jgi:ribosomal protein L11 methyltransferase
MVWSFQALPYHSFHKKETASSLQQKVRSRSSGSKFIHISFAQNDNLETEATSSTAALRALKFVQLTKKMDPALLSDYLMEIGACSVSITDHDKDTDNEDPIFAEPDESNDIFAAIICGDAAVGKNLWMRCDVTAHIPASYDIAAIVDDVRTSFDLAVGVRYIVDDVPDLDWVKEVQSSWKPFVVGDFILKFPWHTKEDVHEAIQKQDGEQNNKTYDEILLEGGIAFGTGEHPTTQLCLGWLQEIVKNDKGMELFLDYGAGSGVLGIAACKINKQLKAVGVEIDVDAIRIADENAKQNGANMKSFLPSSFGNDDESASLIMKAVNRSSVESLPEELDGQRYDACVANILAGPLIGLADTIAGMVKEGGKIGLSGILEWQSDDVIKAYSEHFDDVKVEDTSRGWVLITGERK